MIRSRTPLNYFSLSAVSSSGPSVARPVSSFGAGMKARLLAVLAVAPLVTMSPITSRAQATAASPPASRPQRSGAVKLPERPIRRDIPMTNMIQRAFAAGTRDSTGRPGRNYWQLWTDYKISARLDSATSTVSGHETITFRNISDSAMRSVVLRLDQNIFRPEAPRTGAMDAITDGMKITRLVVNGQSLPVADTLGNPIPNSQRRTPPLSRILRGTSARIPLSAPIAGHSSGTIEADWSFQVPRIEGARGFRMGRWADTLYQVAQWYPRLAVFDDLRGWDTDSYLGDAEFYNNFGHFDVTIDVPAGWIVGAPGVLPNPNTDDGRRTRAGDVVSDLHHVRRLRRGQRDWTPVVADDGRRQRDVVRLDGRRLQSIHEHPLRLRHHRQAVQVGQPRHLLRQGQRQRARAAADVGRKLRRPALWLSGVR